MPKDKPQATATAPDALEHLAEQVDAISAAVQSLRDSGISHRALVLLIRDACPSVQVGHRGHRSRPKTELIEAVIEGMEGLSEYVFPTDGSND